MRRKVSTIIDEALFRRAKVEAARQGRPWNALLEDALRRYFDAAHPGADTRPTVAATWGAMAAPPDVVRQVMEEDDGWLDA
jgi:hypothetical protein